MWISIEKLCMFTNFLYFKVIPVHKKGCEWYYRNYIPISNVPKPSKVFENLINDKIMDYLGTNCLLDVSHLVLDLRRELTDVAIRTCVMLGTYRN